MRSCRLPATRSVTARWLREDVDVVEHDVGRVAAISSSACARSGLRASTLTRRKLRAGVVDAHVEAAGAVVDVVLDVGAAREHDAQRDGASARLSASSDAPLDESLLSLPTSRKRSSSVLATPMSNSSSLLLEQQLVGAAAPTTWRQSRFARLVSSIVDVVERAAVVAQAADETCSTDQGSIAPLARSLTCSVKSRPPVWSTV